MQVTELEGLQRLLLKYFRPSKYKQHKRVFNYLKGQDERAAIRKNEFESRPDIVYRKATAALNHPKLTILQKPLTTFSHSGNCGDVIYSLPAVFKLAGNGQAEIILKIGRPFIYQTFHPLGNVMLNTRMADMLIPLLEYQPRIASCRIASEEATDYDLDLFREYSFSLDRGSIARWYFYVFGISAPLHEAWLQAPKNNEAANAIVIARSHRYRAPLIDYSFLGRYDHLLFLGVEEEYLDMKKSIPNLNWRPVNDFLEMAEIINGCRLFIGNQSFPYAIAEGLKVNRLLEVFYEIPNVIPEGPGANDFYYQPQFEASVARLYENPFS